MSRRKAYLIDEGGAAEVVAEREDRRPLATLEDGPRRGGVSGAKLFRLTHRGRSGYPHLLVGPRGLEEAFPGEAEQAHRRLARAQPYEARMAVLRQRVTRYGDEPSRRVLAGLEGPVRHRRDWLRAGRRLGTWGPTLRPWIVGAALLAGVGLVHHLYHARYATPWNALVAQLERQVASAPESLVARLESSRPQWSGLALYGAVGAHIAACLEAGQLPVLQGLGPQDRPELAGRLRAAIVAGAGAQALHTGDAALAGRVAAADQRYWFLPPLVEARRHQPYERIAERWADHPASALREFVGDWRPSGLSELDRVKSYAYLGALSAETDPERLKAMLAHRAAYAAPMAPEQVEALERLALALDGDFAWLEIEPGSGPFAAGVRRACAAALAGFAVDLGDRAVAALAECSCTAQAAAALAEERYADALTALEGAAREALAPPAVLEAARELARALDGSKLLFPASALPSAKRLLAGEHALMRVETRERLELLVRAAQLEQRRPQDLSPWKWQPMALLLSEDVFRHRRWMRPGPEGGR